MMSQFFHIFLNNKIPVDLPEITNGLLLLTILIFTVITIEKKPAGQLFLEWSHTVQLRGLAALFVIFGHFWSHVSTVRPQLMSKGETVYIFLFFSGFGMVISHTKKKYSFSQSIKQRIKKVMIPYWCATLILVPLAVIINGQFYSTFELLSTFAGINFPIKLNHIDYARWYITFLIIWYFVFYFGFYKLKHLRKQRYLLYFSSVVFLFTVYRPFTFCHQFTAFPLGCIAAEHIDFLRSFYVKHSKSILFLGLISILLSILYKTELVFILYYYGPWQEWLLLALQEIFNILFVFGAVVVSAFFSTNGIKSKFLYSCGLISFPLFLLHGAFLIKFNPVIWHLKDISISISIIIFTAFILGLSYGMKKFTDFISKKTD